MRPRKPKISLAELHFNSSENGLEIRILVLFTKELELGDLKEVESRKIE